MNFHIFAPMLIVLEGLDGAGKSTQVAMLREYLEKKCSSLDYIHFPRYNAPVYGDLISRFLRGEFGDIDNVHPQLVALLFAEDRHGAGPEIKEALSNGRTVLLDRYVYSNIAYQCAKLHSEKETEALRKWIFNTEFGDFELPRPDVNIFLDVPIDFVEHNLNSSREDDSERDYLDGKKDIHESDIRFQLKVKEMYLKQASEDPSLTVVNCSDATGRMLPSEKIFEKIASIIDKAL